MNIDIDPSHDVEEFSFQIDDERFYMIVWVKKALLRINLTTITDLKVGEEAVLGSISSGARVWVTKYEGGHWLAIGDTDSKDVAYHIDVSDLSRLVSELHVHTL